MDNELNMIEILTTIDLKLNTMNKSINKIEKTMVTKEICKIKQESIKDNTSYKKVNIICATISANIIVVAKIVNMIMTPGGIL